MLALATAICAVVGGLLGASEKGLGLLQKIWPVGTAEEGILIKLAKDLPPSQRGEAVAAMKAVYATLSSATEHVKRLQHDQWMRSLYRLIVRTMALIAIAIAAQYVLEHFHKELWVWAVIVVPASCFLLSALSGWDSIKVYAPKLTPYLNKISQHPKTAKLSDLFSEATRAVETIKKENSEALAIPQETVLGDKFLHSYETLMAKIESLEFYCLGLQFVQADEKLRMFLWSNLEEAVVEAVARLAERNLLGANEDDGSDDDFGTQYKIIENSLKTAGVETIFNTEAYQKIWREDLAALMKLSDGKSQLLAKMRAVSQVPTFKQIT